MKLPLRLAATALVCAVAYWIAARAGGVRVTFAATQLATWQVYHDLAMLAASLAPPVLVVALAMRATDDGGLGEYDFFFATNMAILALAGALALVRRALALLAEHRLRARTCAFVVGAWLAVSLFVGGQVAFPAAPLRGSAGHARRAPTLVPVGRARRARCPQLLRRRAPKPCAERHFADEAHPGRALGLAAMQTRGGRVRCRRMSTHRHRASSLPAVLVLLGACAGPAEKQPAPSPAPGSGAAVLEPFQCGEVQRIHTFQNIFLASQPSAQDFEHARKNGIKTVVNLRHPSELKDFDEPAVVEGLGLTYVSLPWNGPDELTDAVFDRGRELLSTSERPLMMHCSSANRIGPIWIAWRVLDGGQTFEQAHAEAVQIGMKTPAYTDKARDYVERRRKG